MKLKKFLSILFAVLLIVSVIPLGVFQVVAETDGMFNYTISNSEATITDLTDKSYTGELSVPSIIGSYPVTRIGSSAFESCYNLTNITIPTSVISIGNYAFYDCSSLKNIVIPDSVTSIGDYAFYNCRSFTSITVPRLVTSIGKRAFYWCINLKNITIPDSVTYIGDDAFHDCESLTSVIIPDSVKHIGSWAFIGCKNLTKVNYTGNIEDWCKISFVDNYSNPLVYAHELYINDELITEVTIPNSVTSIGGYAFYYYTGLNSITIPDSVDSIGGSAFAGCTGLTNINIPDSVTSIGDSAFWCCTGLNNITISDSVASIGSHAFAGCTDLASITIPDGITSIGPYAFLNTSWYNDQPDGLVYAGKVVYGYKGMCTSGVSIKDEMVAIADYAFYHCDGLKTIVIPDCVTTIGDSAFCDCNGLSVVKYTGTEEQKGRLNIKENNQWLNNATWYYGYKSCDINDDGLVNNKDLTRLFQYLSDWDVEVNEAALDVNGDGNVNNKDLTRLFQYLSDWDVEIF